MALICTLSFMWEMPCSFVSEFPFRSYIYDKIESPPPPLLLVAEYFIKIPQNETSLPQLYPLHNKINRRQPVRFSQKNSIFVVWTLSESFSSQMIHVDLILYWTPLLWKVNACLRKTLQSLLSLRVSLSSIIATLHVSRKAASFDWTDTRHCLPHCLIRKRWYKLRIWAQYTNPWILLTLSYSQPFYHFFCRRTHSLNIVYEFNYSVQYGLELGSSNELTALVRWDTATCYSRAYLK
jgi:hypothetical protein